MKLFNRSKKIVAVILCAFLVLPMAQYSFSVSADTFSIYKGSIEGEIHKAPYISDLNEDIAAYFPQQKPKVYSGYIFGEDSNSVKSDFFFRPSANTETITLYIGANVNSNTYKNPKFKINVYNTKETYNKIDKYGLYDSRGMKKYRDTEYYSVTVEADKMNSVVLPWVPEHSIIEIINKDNISSKVYISVKANVHGVNSIDPYTPEVDSSIYDIPNKNNNVVDTNTLSSPVEKLTRISGDNRYMTSIKLSQESFTHSNVAIVASGKNFADALSGGGLASSFNAPLLLVDDSSAEEVNAELNRLGVKTLYVLGGQSSISSSLENKVYYNSNKERRNIIRLAGDNRYETSMAIYDEAVRSGLNKNPILVNGKNFADALSAGPLSAKLRMPIVLTDGHNVSSKINKDNRRNIVVGGYSSMDSSFQGDRIAGANRYETASRIASRFYNPGVALVASGEQYPDGLSSITLYSKFKAPLLLTPKYSFPSENMDYLKEQKVNHVIIVGGDNSVSETVASEIK